MISKLTNTSENVRRKVNDIIDEVNHLSRRNPDVEMHRTLRQVPYRKGGSGTGCVRGVVFEAPDGTNEIDCNVFPTYDPDGVTVTVVCSISGGTALNAASPRLEVDDIITVWKDGDTWRSTMTFQATEDCE